MAGFVGERARRRKRNIVISFIIIILVLLIYLIIPKFQLNENTLSDTLLPTEEEIVSPESTIDNEELELQIFQKEQKIIFRDQQISKLQKKIEILINENSQLSESVNKQLTDIINQNVEIEDSEGQIKKIQSEAEQKIIKLNQEIKNIKKNNDVLNKSQEENINENQLLKKDYKSLFNKNVKQINENKNLVNENKNLVTENKNLEILIQNLEQLIKEQKTIIKKLDDTSHH